MNSYHGTIVRYLRGCAAGLRAGKDPMDGPLTSALCLDEAAAAMEALAADAGRLDWLGSCDAADFADFLRRWQRAGPGRDIRATIDAVRRDSEGARTKGD